MDILNKLQERPNAKARTKNHLPLHRRIQGNRGPPEPASGRVGQRRRPVAYIHPFMLSRWRKLAREGQIMTKGVDVDPAVAAELKELRQVKKQYERLKLEHDLLKKAIAFTSARRATSSPSSSTTRKRTR